MHRNYGKKRSEQITIIFTHTFRCWPVVRRMFRLNVMLGTAKHEDTISVSELMKSETKVYNYKTPSESVNAENKKHGRWKRN